jgi:hypothetical protein
VSIRRRTGRAAGSSSQRTAATHGRRSAATDFPQAGPHRHRRRAESRARVCDRRCAGRRHVSLRRCGRELDAHAGDARIWSRGWYFGEVTVEPDNADIVYSLQRESLPLRRRRQDVRADQRRPGGDDYHALWIDPDIPPAASSASIRGAVVSVNGGRTWSSWYNQPTAQLYHVTTDNSFPVLPLRRAAGLRRGEHSEPHEHDRRHLDDELPRDHRRRRERQHRARSEGSGRDLRRPRRSLDLRTQQTRSVDPTLAHPENNRRTWTLPLVFSRRDPYILYFANQRLFRTDNGGEQWTVISPDLTREDPGTPPNLDPTTAALHQQTGPRRGVIYSIAPSRTADRDLWVGTDDGLIWRTRDEGAHWQNVTPAALTSWSKVGIIDASPFDSESAYAAIDRHRLDDFRPYIYRTHDGGKSWTLIVAGIPSDHAVNVVREDSVRKGLLYAGTERASSCHSTTASSGSRCSKTCR